MPNEQNLQWTHLNNFTPGIFTKDSFTGIGPAPAPLGSAQLSGTYGCYALPQGGLAPLPGLNGQFPIPSPNDDAHLLVGHYIVNGIQSFGPVGPPAASASGIPDDIFVGVEYLSTASGGERILTYSRMNMDTTGTPADTLATIVSAQHPTTDQYRGMCFVVTRINPSSPYLTPGNPVMVANWSPPGFAADKHIWVFPDPSAPNTTSVVELYTASGLSAIVGDLIAHQNRIIILEDNTYPFGGNSGDLIPTNEQVSFTDPANSNTFDTNSTVAYQRQVFVQEFPNGYGAWGSISNGELFLIKSEGGGVVIGGSIDSPNSVTRLPGVISTKGAGNRASATTQGLVYYSRYQGGYIWNGSNTSQEISTQLNNDFPIYTDANVSTNSNLGYFLNQQICWQEWGTWILCSNNWLYDTTTNSWWQLSNPATQQFQWYCRSFFGENLYACPLGFRNNAAFATGLSRFTRNKPTVSYQWTGQPILVSIDRTVVVREITLLAKGVGTVAITYNCLDGTTRTETFTLSSTTQPQFLRLPTAGTSSGPESYSLVIKIAATGTALVNPTAPTIYDLGIGYQERIKAASV